MNIKEVFGDEISNKLNTQSDFKIVAKKTLFGKPNSDIESKIKGKFGLSDSLKEDLIQIYTQVEKIELYWSLNDPKNKELLKNDSWIQKNYQSYTIDQDFSGCMNLVTFDEMMNDKDFFAHLNKNGVRYMPFDKHWALGIGLKMEKGKVENNLYLNNTEGNELIDLKIGLLDYLNFASNFCCFYYWQYALLSKKGDYFSRVSTMLPKILPNINILLS